MIFEWGSNSSFPVFYLLSSLLFLSMLSLFVWWFYAWLCWKRRKEDPNESRSEGEKSLKRMRDRIAFWSKRDIQSRKELKIEEEPWLWTSTKEIILDILKLWFHCIVMTKVDFYNHRQSFWIMNFEVNLEWRRRILKMMSTLKIECLRMDCPAALSLSCPTNMTLIDAVMMRLQDTMEWVCWREFEKSKNKFNFWEE
jgi:hypothetical protein